MAKVLVFQHVKVEPQGLLSMFLRKHNIRVRYVNFSRQSNPDINISKYDGLVVLGGAMSAYDDDNYPHLAVERKFIKQALDYNIPILGICLGAQLLAQVLGAKVKRHVKREIGWYELSSCPSIVDDPLFFDLKDNQKVFQWHTDTFDIPKDAKLLATGYGCHNQIFNYNNVAWGMQCHLEVDDVLINRWLSSEHYLKELEDSFGLSFVDQIKADTSECLPLSQVYAKKLFHRFIEYIDTKKQRKD